MIIQSLELADFRNYETLGMEFSEGTNIFYGDNAQGKTNILESIYMISTTKSHRGVKDRDLIRFGREEAHIRTVLIKNGIDYKVDMHLRKNRSKGIAINGQRIRKASELIGLLHMVFFSPEDLSIVKNGPSERRRFMDVELCQLDADYLYNLNHYNKIIDQRNRLLKDIVRFPEMRDTLDVWDEQLVSYGRKIIERRSGFINSLNEIVGGLHEKLSGGREKLVLSYEPNTDAVSFPDRLRDARDRDCYLKQTTTGPHRDDLTGDRPVLMLDDVLSELDSRRQNYLLDTIGDIQTFITCTGLDEFVNHRFAIDTLYRIEAGKVSRMSGPAVL